MRAVRSKIVSYIRNGEGAQYSPKKRAGNVHLCNRSQLNDDKSWEEQTENKIFLAPRYPRKSSITSTHIQEQAKLG